MNERLGNVCILRHGVHYLQSYSAPACLPPHVAVWNWILRLVFRVIFALNTDQFPQSINRLVSVETVLSAIGTEFICIIWKNEVYASYWSLEFLYFY
jgi:hypothetical protein